MGGFSTQHVASKVFQKYQINITGYCRKAQSNKGTRQKTKVENSTLGSEFLIFFSKKNLKKKHGLKWLKMHFKHKLLLLLFLKKCGK